VDDLRATVQVLHLGTIVFKARGRSLGKVRESPDNCRVTRPMGLREAHLSTDTRSPPRGSGAFWQAAGKERRRGDGGNGRACAGRPCLALEGPEIDAVLRAFKARHYATWPDERLPALDGLTPRQAAAKPKYRRTFGEATGGDERGESQVERAGVRLRRNPSHTRDGVNLWGPMTLDRSPSAIGRT